MCIKNDDCKNLLAIFRKIEKEGLDSLSKQEVCDSLVVAKVLNDDIEKHFDNLRAKAKDLGVEKEIYADYGKKVLLKEGTATSKPDPEWIGKELQKIGKVESYFKISNIVKKRVKELNDPVVTQIVEQCSTPDVGKSYISVVKLNKGEVAEALANKSL